MNCNACIRNTREEDVNPIVRYCNAPESNTPVQVHFHSCRDSTLVLRFLTSARTTQAHAISEG